MGLFKRGKVWWMAITYQGNRIRRSTGTSNKKMAEAVIAKVHVKIIEGQFFDTLQEKERTVDEMMKRYMKEHLVKTRSATCNNHYLKNLLPFFGHYTLAEITPRLIAEYKSRRYDAGRAPATINRELAAMKAAFIWQ